MSGAQRRKNPKRDGGGAPARRDTRPTSRQIVYAALRDCDAQPLDEQAAHAPAFSDIEPGEDVRERFSEAVESLDAAGEGMLRELGRVVRLDRDYPLVLTESGFYRAEHAASVIRTDEVRAAVGDWVVLDRPTGHVRAQIAAIVERRGVLSRWDGGNRDTRQVLAANIDMLLVAQPLSSREVDCGRIARSLVLAAQGGMRCAVVLTKLDRVDACRAEAEISRVRAVVGRQIEVVAVSSTTGEHLEDVRGLVAPGSCALLLGESGAGKSTLINALIGEEVLASGAVRDKDDRGRHTTVARRMLKVPNGGVLVDAPGLRSIYLLDEQLGLARAFSDIDDLVEGCRFRNCTHGSEPGCAVQEAVRAGEIPMARLEAYRSLASEMNANRRRLDPSCRSSITR